MAELNTQVTHHTAVINSITLHYVTAGDPAGEPVVLLHGFPEFWYGWRNQISFLVEQGYFVIAPDQRGYNTSGKPPRVRDYALDNAVDDWVALLDHLGLQDVFLVGHDFGAAVSWLGATKHPDRVRKLAILNVPHLAVMARHLRSNPEQRRRSWYMFAFQLPWLPEWLLGQNDSERGIGILIGSSKPGSFTEEDLARYREAWAQPGAWRGMLNWYRAMFRSGLRVSTPTSQLPMPVHIIWGQQDIALGEDMAVESLEYCADGVLTMIPDATHWVQHDASDQVNTILLDFFTVGK